MHILSFVSRLFFCTLALMLFSAVDSHAVHYRYIYIPTGWGYVAQNARMSFYSGAYTTNDSDMEVAARGIPMVWERNYRSNMVDKTVAPSTGLQIVAPYDGPIGFGWTNGWLVRVEGSAYINSHNRRIPFEIDSTGALKPNVAEGLRLTKTATGFELVEIGRYTYTFDTAGKLQTVRDKRSNSARLTYDASGNLTSITDAADRQIFTISHNAAGRIASVTDLTGLTVTYDYDANGDLTTVKRNGTTSATYTYNINHGMLTKTNALGETYTTEYYPKWQDKGVVKRIIDPIGSERLRLGQSTAGHETSFKYDFDNRVIYTTDYNGTEFIRGYNGSGQVVSVGEIKNGTSIPVSATSYDNNHTATTTDAQGNISIVQADEWGNIIKQVDGEGGVKKSTYTSDSKLKTATDQLGIITKNDYDTNSNLTKTTWAIGKPEETSTTYIYDSRGQVTSETTGGATKTATWNDQGLPATITDAEGNITSYTYDTAGNPASVTDAMGNKTSYSFDANGNLLTITDPLNNKTSYTYNTANRLTSMTDPLGRITTFETDFKGRITAAIDPLGIRTEYAYDGNGNKTKISRGDSIITMAYDSMNRMSSLTDPEGNTINYSYNPSSCASCGANVTNIEQITDPLGNTTNYSYDKAKRVTGITDPLSNITKLQRDAAGKITTRTDANNNSTGYQNDALKRIAKQTDANGNNITFSYDTRGNLTQLTDQNGNSTIFAYDKNNRVTKETRPMGQTTDYTYWPNGTLKTTKDAKNQTTQYTYDAASRLTEITYADSTKDTFDYDANGNLTSYAKPGVQGTITYDELRRKTGETVNYGTFSKTFSYTYDAKGNKASYTSPEGTAYTYGYNKNGQPTGIAFSGKTITFDYQWIRQTKQTLPNGITTNFGYNVSSWLSAMETKQNSTTLGSQNYQFDNVGNITGKTGDISAAYGYDKIYQLTSAGQETFTFDKTGNRTMSGYSHNANNELTATTTATYVYDANGNTISKTEGTQVTTYGYDVRNRLVQVTLPDGTTASYTYDPFGRRIKKQTPTDTTYYLYANEGLIGEYTETGTTKKAYGWRPKGIWGTNPLFQIDNGNYYYYHNDHLGTPQRITDESGSTVWNATYSAFGKATVTVSTISSNLRLPGQYADEETGLHYNWFRYYDVGTGRYISVDPIGFWAGDVNLYRYVQNNSVNFVDSLGLAAGTICYGGNPVPYSTGSNGQIVVAPIRSGVIDGYNAAMKEMSYWAGKASIAALGAIATVGFNSKKFGVFAYEWADYLYERAVGNNPGIPNPIPIDNFTNPPDASGRTR